MHNESNDNIHVKKILTPDGVVYDYNGLRLIDYPIIEDGDIIGFETASADNLTPTEQ